MTVIKRILSALVAIALTLCILAGIAQIVERKESDFRYKPFFEETENFDILFFGTSHVYYGIQPMKLWNDYGLVSYNLAGPDNYLPTTYWVVKNALDYKKPKLVVLDCYTVSRELKTTSLGKNHVHTTFDAFPLTINKAQAIFDLFEDNDTRSEFLWNFILYHSRWQELAKNDFLTEYNLCKGGAVSVVLNSTNTDKSFPSEEKLPEDAIGIQYLRKTIELCQENDIDVLLTYIPYFNEERAYIEANSIYDIADEYGVNYIDFLRIEDILRYSTDFSDNVGHLNKAGGVKITAYIGDYIKKNYEISNRKGDPSYSSWHEDYNKYFDQNMSRMYAEKYLSRYFVQLYDNDINSVIYLQNAKKMSNHQALLNLGVDAEKLAPEEPIVIIIDNDSDERIKYLSTSEKADTSFGTVIFHQDNDGCSISINENNYPTIDVGTAAVTIPINNRTKEILESSYFEWNGTTYYKMEE